MVFEQLLMLIEDAVSMDISADFRKSSFVGNSPGYW